MCYISMHKRYLPVSDNWKWGKHTGDAFRNRFFFFYHNIDHAPSNIHIQYIGNKITPLYSYTHPRAMMKASKSDVTVSQNHCKISLSKDFFKNLINVVYCSLESESIYVQFILELSINVFYFSVIIIVHMLHTLIFKMSPAHSVYCNVAKAKRASLRWSDNGTPFQMCRFSNRGVF